MDGMLWGMPMMGGGFNMKPMKITNINPNQIKVLQQAFADGSNQGGQQQQQKKKKKQPQQQKKKKEKKPNDPAMALALNYRGQINRYSQVMKDKCPQPLQVSSSSNDDGSHTATAVMQVE